MEPLCSIVIPVYNKGPFIAQTVDSALAQTYPNVENYRRRRRSTDCSAAVLGAYTSRIKFVRQANGGQASAMNRGFFLSRGEIVFFLDGDDALLPNTVEQVVKIWSPDSRRSIFGSKNREDGSRIFGEFLPHIGRCRMVT